MTSLSLFLQQPQQDIKNQLYSETAMLQDMDYVFPNDIFEQYIQSIVKQYIHENQRCHSLTLEQKIRCFEQCASFFPNKKHTDYALYKQYCIDNKKHDHLFFMKEFESIKITRHQAINFLKQYKLENFYSKRHFDHVHKYRLDTREFNDVYTHSPSTVVMSAFFWHDLLKHLNLYQLPRYKESCISLTEKTLDLPYFCELIHSKEYSISDLPECSCVNFLEQYFLSEKTLNTEIPHIDALDKKIRAYFWYKKLREMYFLYDKIRLLSVLFPEYKNDITIGNDKTIILIECERQLNGLLWNNHQTRAEFFNTIDALGGPYDKRDDTTYLNMQEQHLIPETNEIELII